MVKSRWTVTIFCSVAPHTPISEDVKKMRFGKVIWSENDGIIKKSIVLVEEIYDKDEEKQFNLFQPEFDNSMRILAYYKNINDELVKLLISKGTLSNDEFEKIKSDAKSNIWILEDEFFKVKDIDKF